MIKYIQGDLLTAKVGVIAHGCNCFQTMGAGVAAAIRKEYPGAYKADLDYSEYGELCKLGTYSKWFGEHKIHIGHKFYIVNLYTQWLYDVRTKPFDYNAFIEVFEKMLNDFPASTIALPKIGSGLAGGNWEIIESIINIISKDREIQIYIL